MLDLAYMPHLRWEAPEFDHHPKNVSWYWISILIAILLLALAVWQKNFFFGVFIVIAEVLVLAWASVEPPMIKFELTEKGLRVGPKRFYRMRELEAFSADVEGLFNEEWPDIVLHLRSHFRPAVRIKAPRHWLHEIRQEFRDHNVKELHFEPTFLEIVEKFMRF